MWPIQLALRLLTSYRSVSLLSEYIISKYYIQRGRSRRTLQLRVKRLCTTMQIGHKIHIKFLTTVCVGLRNEHPGQYVTKPREHSLSWDANNSLHFKEPECSLPRSQQPATRNLP
jgi:hypothetical protein